MLEELNESDDYARVGLGRTHYLDYFLKNCQLIIAERKLKQIFTHVNQNVSTFLIGEL